MNKINFFNRAKRKLEQKSFEERMQERITLQAGDNSVIDNAQLPRLDKGRAVILTQDVYETLKMIGDISNEKNFEVPFLLFGKIEEDTGFVVIDDVEADRSSGEWAEAVFTEKLNSVYAQYLQNAKPQENKIVFQGHSHPAANNGYYLNYSLGDVNAYKTMRDSQFTKNVSIGGCLLTGGNYNFVFCDGNDVYRFDNVFVQDKNGELTQLPAFGPDQRLIAARGRGRI